MLCIVITGSPGVGKHTIGRAVAKDLGLDIIDLNIVAADNGIIEESGDVDVDMLRDIIRQNTADSVVIGHLAPYVLEEQRVKKAIVLRKSPYELIPVYKKRRYSEYKTRENLASEILGIVIHDTIDAFGYTRTLQVDTTKKTIKDTIQQTKDALERDASNDVDWLSLVLEKNDLARFFSYD